MRPRIRQGDDLLLSIASSVALGVEATAEILGDDGLDYSLHIPRVVSAATRATENFESAGKSPVNGFINAAYVGYSPGVGVTPQRGQTLAVLQIRRGGSKIYTELSKGYLDPLSALPLGQLEIPSRVPGTGFYHNKALADNIQPADIEHTFGIANTVRRIDGFVWWFHASSDVTDRTLRVSMRDMGDGLPTGLTSGGNSTTKRWPSAGVLTLSADQEGLIYVNAADGKSFAASVDTGAVPTIEDITTQPDPLPYWAQADDVGELFFDVANVSGNDRHSIYIIEEEWVTG